MGVLFVSVVVVMPTISFSNLKTVDQQQLKNTALNVFNTILLDTGLGFDGTELTTDWGSMNPWNSTALKRFGLARSIDSNMYLLDPDKVQRLESSILGNISINEVKDLLGITDYGLSLRIIPPFNVTNLDGTLLTENSPIFIDGCSLEFNIRVTYLDGRPIPNANVKAIAVYSDRNQFDQSDPMVATTDALGVCGTSTVLEFEPNFVTVILRITVADVATLVVTTGANSIDSINVGLAGDDVSLRIEKDPADPTTPTTFINEIWALGSQENPWLLFQGDGDKFTPSESGNFEFWNNTFTGLGMHEPVLLILNLNTVPKGEDITTGGRQDVVVAGPYQKLLGYSVFQFGDDFNFSNAAVRLQRSVIISGMTYTAELIFWKE